MSEILLEVKDLVIHYFTDGEEAFAVNGLSFDLAPQEVIGFVGETGAGKTTTAMLTAMRPTCREMREP